MCVHALAIGGISRNQASSGSIFDKDYVAVYDNSNTP